MSEVKTELSGPDLVQGVALSTIADGAMLLGHAHGESALLGRRGDELFAVGNVCTHYGAPLAAPPNCRSRSSIVTQNFFARSGRTKMTRRFDVGDHVVWNSEAGQVSGKIIKVHIKNIAYKGYTHHASKEDPQYEIKSDKTDHIAMHKGSALKKVND